MAVAAAPAPSPAGRCGSRSGSRSLPGSAAAAPTRDRDPARERQLPAPLEPPELLELAATLGADVPFFLDAGPQLGTGDGTTLAPIDLPQDYSVLLVVPHGDNKPSTADIYADFDARDGAAGFDGRRAALLERSTPFAGRAISRRCRRTTSRRRR